MTIPEDPDPTTALVRGPPEGLCLDFVNTRSWRGTASPTEELQAPSDLLLWIERSGALDIAMLRRTCSDWQAAPARAEASLATALGVREALFRIFAATTAVWQPTRPIWMPSTCRTPRRSRTQRACGTGLGGCVWELPPRTPDPGLLLAPVLWSAGDLLAGSRRRLVRQCANPQCRWLFVDDSKSGTRRWCSMASCGNRAKAHRHYAKRRHVTPTS